MARIFISHSSRDDESAGRIIAWLKAHGFEEIFLDIDKHGGILPGAEWERTLYREIARSQAVILIVTANWHASRWCWSEFTQARALGKAIFPIIETPTGETMVAPDIQHLDLTSDREGGLERLRASLGRHCPRAARLSVGCGAPTLSRPARHARRGRRRSISAATTTSAGPRQRRGRIRAPPGAVERSAGARPSSAGPAGARHACWWSARTATRRSIEVAHEALLRKWPRLRAWLDEEREFLIGKAQLERSLGDWQQAEQNAKPHALLHGLQLNRAKQWLVDHRSGLTDVEHSYIQSSIAHASGVQKKASRQRAALLASVLGLLAIAAVGGPFAYGVISERRLIDREAARTDLRGQIVAYATAVVGGTAADRAEGYETSPYTTPLVQRLRQKNKSLIEALADVHQDVIGLTNGAQRPFLSTSMNGHVYLWQQPVSRAKRAVVISVDDIHWRNVPALLAPKYDAQAVVGVLREAGFKDDEIIKLHNVSRERIDAAIADAIKSFPSRKPNVSGFLPAPHAPGALPVVPTGLVAGAGGAVRAQHAVAGVFLRAWNEHGRAELLASRPAGPATARRQGRRSRRRQCAVLDRAGVGPCRRLDHHPGYAFSSPPPRQAPINF